jgi:hypothetical protein
LGGEEASPERRGWKITERGNLLLGIVTALIAVAGSIYTGVSYLLSSTAEHKIQKEQKLVQRLIPGTEFERIKQKLRAQPDYSFKLPSGNTIYQYERKWETLQFVKDPAGATVSTGVYSKSPDFHAAWTLGSGGITLNHTRVSQCLLWSP